MIESYELLLQWYDIPDMAQAEGAYLSKPKKNKQRNQTATTIWAPFIKTALLSQPPKDCTTQLEKREDLSALLRVLLFLPYVSRDKPLCSPSVSHCPRPCPCKPSEQQQTIFVHRENEESSSFVSNCADSAQ